MIQKAIQFMEDHILEHIGPEDVAKHLHVSQFHLHRIFKIFCGVSVSEYIRNRRLSLAGLDVVKNKETLLDLALKYQYDSQEGFQKAFYRFHGVNPSKAKYGKAKLKAYHPLKIQIKFEGGSSMDYRIVKKEPFTLLCVKKAFLNKIIEDDNNQEIPNFWTKKLDDGTVRKLLEVGDEKELYGPCNAVSLESDSFYYGIGVPYSGGKVEEFDLWHIKHPLYAVFTCKEVDDMGPTWKGIMEEFLPNSEYEMADEADFEVYPSEDAPYFCEIWVPIQ